MDNNNLSPDIQSMLAHVFPELLDTDDVNVSYEQEGETEASQEEVSEESFEEANIVTLSESEPINDTETEGSDFDEPEPLISLDPTSVDIESLEPVPLDINTITVPSELLEEENSVEPKESSIKIVQANYARFKGADWFEIVQKQRIVLAGLGGIGSYVSLLLARLGPSELYLYDDDIFESHNMSGQFVGSNDVGKAKATVAMERAIEFGNYLPSLYLSKYEYGKGVKLPVMICGFDNMKARKDYYKSWKDYVQSGEVDPKECLFIDGRLLAEEYQIICITGDDTYSQEDYEKVYLFDDEDVEEEDCTLKQTSHVAIMIASKMVAYFINFCNNLSEDNFPRRLPYFTHHNSLMNTYEFNY